MLTEVPDYTWYAGCFGTASGNLMGYWDRHGFPEFYTGSANGGLAPLDSNGENVKIRSMWASQAGFDGRPLDQPGHVDDYWTYLNDDYSYSYQSTDPDPYTLAGRAEHEPDCLGDFIGLSQRKWTNLDGECAGNIDAFSFNFWDKSGVRRLNFDPPSEGTVPMRDIQSGLRHWTEYKGHGADVFSQLVDFNPETPIGAGFTFEDLKAEIDAGYPVLLFLQTPGEYSRELDGISHLNPEMHGMLAYGYVVTDTGQQYMRYKNSWGSSGDNSLLPWQNDLFIGLGIRGVIGYHPRPKISNLARTNGELRVEWEGPQSALLNITTGESKLVNWFAVEKAGDIQGPFEQVGQTTSNLEMTLPDSGDATGFFRIRVLTPAEAGQVD
jgi:hypothetical protein